MSLRGLCDDHLDIFVDVEFAALAIGEVSLENLPKRNPRFDLLGRQSIHLAIAAVRDHKPLLVVPHAEAVRHIAQGDAEQTVQFLNRAYENPAAVNPDNETAEQHDAAENDGGNDDNFVDQPDRCGVIEAHDDMRMCIRKGNRAEQALVAVGIGSCKQAIPRCGNVVQECFRHAGIAGDLRHRIARQDDSAAVNQQHKCVLLFSKRRGEPIEPCKIDAGHQRLLFPVPAILKKQGCKGRGYPVDLIDQKVADAKRTDLARALKPRPAGQIECNGIWIGGADHFLICANE